MNSNADQRLHDMEQEEFDAERQNIELKKEVGRHLTKGYVYPKKRKYHGQEEEASRIRKQRR